MCDATDGCTAAIVIVCQYGNCILVDVHQLAVPIYAGQGECLDMRKFTFFFKREEQLLGDPPEEPPAVFEALG